MGVGGTTPALTALLVRTSSLARESFVFDEPAESTTVGHDVEVGMLVAARAAVGRTVTDGRRRRVGIVLFDPDPFVPSALLGLVGA